MPMGSPRSYLLLNDCISVLVVIQCLKEWSTSSSDSLSSQEAGSNISYTITPRTSKVEFFNVCEYCYTIDTILYFSLQLLV